MIAIVDYGVGNLFSLQSSLRAIGADSVVTGSSAELERAERIILPGVGAFADAIARLREGGLDKVICGLAQNGTPLLGVCLGMQMLFDKSLEYGEHTGLGLIPGCVRPIADVTGADYKIPHIGWNGLIFPKDREKHPLMRYIGEGRCVYFVHSYYAADCGESVIAYAEYGAMLTAAAAHKNIYGCQFHPEKSGDAGLSILKAFCEM